MDRDVLPTLRQKVEPTPPPHPQAGEAWYEALPAEKQAAFDAEWRASLARDAVLGRLDVHRGRREILQVVALFAVADLVCPGRSLVSFAAALVVGAATGALLHKLDAGRFRTSALGIAAFLALQVLTRGGLSGLHMFVLFPAICCLAYWGYLREERGME